MPIPENTGATEFIDQAGPADGRMSRRSVLRGAAGVGAAGLAVTALSGLPGLAGGRLAKPAAHTQSDADEPPTDEAVVVHVRDLRAGQLDVYRGTTHVRVQDRELAWQLAKVSY
jgi:hypothetical protein